MIVGDRFVWLHFPKCAGTEVSRVLEGLADRNPDLIADDRTLVNVHDDIDSRLRLQPDAPLRGKDVIACFRRLPYWMLSRVHFGYFQNPKHVPTRADIVAGRVFESDGHLSQADDYARRYTQNARFLLRTENIYDDFCAAFSGYLDFDPVRVRDAFTNRNASPLRYIPDIRFWFTPSELAALYEAAPYWAMLERHLYGQLVQH